jgi:hypothetical protein
MTRRREDWLATLIEQAQRMLRLLHERWRVLDFGCENLSA